MSDAGTYECRAQKTSEHEKTENKFINIYYTVASYKPGYEKYMGLTPIDLVDLGQYYMTDAASIDFVMSEFAIKIEPFKDYLGYLNPEYYVYAYNF